MSGSGGEEGGGDATREDAVPASPPPSPPPHPRGGVGLGLGWTRVAEALRATVPASDIAQIWLFPPVRKDEREWGTAVIARRVCEGRLRIYTAGYVLVLRGRERGQGRVQVEDVGETPDAVVREVLKGVQDRAGEAEPPVEVDVALWYPDPGTEPEVNGDEPASEG